MNASPTSTADFKKVCLPIQCVKAFCLGILIFWTNAVNAASGNYRIEAASKEVKGSSLRTVTCEAHYSQPPEEVWKLLNDFHSHPEYIPRLKAFESLGVANGSEQVYLQINLPIPFPDIWNIVALVKDEKKHRFEWKMLQGNMEKNNGNLTIEPEGKGSLVKVEVEADMGRLLPKWVVVWGAKNFLPKVLKALGQRLDNKSAAPPKK
jgi:carbon monoxide dehydrogenase subunit G